MITYRYSVADILVNVSVQDGYFDPIDNDFLITGGSSDESSKLASDIDVTCKCEPLEHFRQYAEFNEYGISYRMDGPELRFFIYDQNQKLRHVIISDKLLKQASILSEQPYMIPFEHCPGEMLFRAAILHHNGIMIHSSAIAYRGCGIVFSAPAGTGKSTQADLWREHLGATVLNGDRAAIRLINDIPYVYGPNWSGSSLDRLNKKAPLKAIVMLEQAKTNEIRELTHAEAVRYLLPRCYMQTGVASQIELALENLESILAAVPVYLLKCLPDREAVELTCKIIGL